MEWICGGLSGWVKGMWTLGVLRDDFLSRFISKQGCTIFWNVFFLYEVILFSGSYYYFFLVISDYIFLNLTLNNSMNNWHSCNCADALVLFAFAVTNTKGTWRWQNIQGCFGTQPMKYLSVLSTQEPAVKLLSCYLVD